MKKTRTRVAVSALGMFAGMVAVLANLAPAQTSSSVQFPKDYRRWAHVKSALIGPAFPAYATEGGGIHHVYANDLAVDGFRTGKFPDGSILVYELLETREQGGVTSEGSRRRVDVMQKESRAHAGSGGWTFERFMGDNQGQGVLNEASRTQCAQCHEQRKDHDSVFSELRK